MPSSGYQSGLKLTYKAEHRNGLTGELICSMFTVEAPQGYESPSKRNIKLYLRRSIMFVLLSKYHALRIELCERASKKSVKNHTPLVMEKLPERYRTGEPAPTTIRQCLIEIYRLRLRL
jgi:hypothetical protein